MKVNMRTEVLAGQISALAVEGKSDMASYSQKVESKLYYLFYKPLPVPGPPIGYSIVVGEVRERVNRSSRRLLPG